MQVELRPVKDQHKLNKSAVNTCFSIGTYNCFCLGGEFSRDLLIRVILISPCLHCDILCLLFIGMFKSSQTCRMQQTGKFKMQLLTVIPGGEVLDKV